MDSSGDLRGPVMGGEQMNFAPEQMVGGNFEVANNNEALEATNPVETRANNNAETQRIRAKLQGVFSLQRAQAAQAVAASSEQTEEPVSPELQALKAISVPKDAEKMPAAFAKQAQSILQNDLKKKSVADMVDDLIIIRWDYIYKAYGRKMKDGLNKSN